VGALVCDGAGAAALHPVPDLTAGRHHGLAGRLAADRAGLPATASEGAPGRATTSSRPPPTTLYGSASTQRQRPHATPWTASGNQPPHSPIGGSRLSLDGTMELVHVATSAHWLRRRRALRREALDFADRINHFKEVCVEMDVFIAHASEDKEAVARPLAAELRRQGFRVWYDEYSLRVGDSLNEKINDGLAVARFGVIIISPNFMEKEWPQRELNGLLAVDEGERHGHILPIWHNVTAAQVRAWNPIMADRVATSTSKGLPAVVADIAAVLQGREAPRLPVAVLPTKRAQ
jgi:TIR domain